MTIRLLPLEIGRDLVSNSILTVSAGSFHLLSFASLNLFIKLPKLVDLLLAVELWVVRTVALQNHSLKQRKVTWVYRDTVVVSWPAITDELPVPFLLT